MYKLDRSYGKRTYERWESNLDASRIAGSNAKNIRHRNLSESR